MGKKTETLDVTIAPPVTDSKTANWHAVLSVEGVRTSDGREFAPNSLHWRTLPLPLMWQMESAEGHKGSVVVGRIDQIQRQGNEIHGWGTFDLGSPNGREAHRLVSEQIMRGVSIDAELLHIDKEQLIGGEDGEVTLYVEEAKIGAATIVHFPAFPQAVIALDGSPIPPATADGRGESVPTEETPADSTNASAEDVDGPDSVSHDDNTTFAVSDKPWDGSPSRFTDQQFRSATAGCRGTGAPPKSDCFLQHHEPGGAVSRAGVHAAAARFNQTQAPAAALSRARGHLNGHYRRDLKETPPKVLMAMALIAHAEQQGPPAAWFVDPELKGPTPLTVARNGRVYGHAALWDACHTGYNQCMKAPHSRTNYSHFLTGAVFTSDCDCDTATATGPITLGTTHANPYSPPDTARHHYDNTGLAVADVVVGEDSFGIWIAGSLRPGVTEAQIRALRGSSLSGDWRYIGGNMELISLLAVNTPGFPIPRVAAAVEDEIQVSLVAAGIPEDTPPSPEIPTGSDPASLLEELKREREAAGEEATDESTPTDDSTEGGNGNEEEASDDENATAADKKAEDQKDEPALDETPPSSGLSTSSLIDQLKVTTR